MVKKAPDLLLIEEVFGSIKSNPKGNHRTSLETIKRVISRRYDLKVEINIVDNTGLEFFGMSIYPEEDVVDKMVHALVEGTNRIQVVEEIWAKNKNWVIDIDSYLIFDSVLNTNPAEITAVLLHEIGHTVHSNEIPSRVGRVLKYSHMNFSITVKKVLKWSKARKIMGLAFIEACSTPNFHTHGLRKESVADRMAVKEGYTEDLAQFIEKLITRRGTKLVDVTEAELDQGIETVVQWGVENISQLEYRKNILNRNIQAQLLATHSPYVRNYLMNIRGLFFGKSEERIKQLVAEQYTMKEYQKYTVTTEAFRDLFNKYGKIEKVSQQDIDYIIIEANRIDNENDRIYVLDLIYAKLDVIELSFDLLSNSDTASRVQVSKDTLKRQKEELLGLRKQVMGIRIRPKESNVLVTYPLGYEG